MKKLIITLTLLLTFGLNYGTNRTEESNNNYSVLCENLTNSFNNISLINIVKVSENMVGSTCEDLAVAVGTAAIQSGYSLQATLTMVYDVKTACDALLLLASAL